MHWCRTYPGTADQARLVRRFVGFLLDESPLVDDAVLAAAELAVNAIRHMRSGLPGGVFTVEVRRWSGDVAVAVTDQSSVRGPA